MAKKIEAEQPAYGQAQVLDAAEQSLQEATPVAPPSEEAIAVQEAVAGEQPPVEEMPANAPVPQGQPTGFTVRNRFNLLPTQANFQANQQRQTPVERDYNMSLYWDLLASGDRFDPMARLVAKKLKSGG